MSMGKQGTEQQGSLWIETSSLPKTAGHPFYERLNAILQDHGFDAMAGGACATFYAKGVGRPSTPSGVYFRMLFVGFFEGIDLERGIAWRAADSMALRSFLGYSLDETTPNHSNLSRKRNRIDLDTHQVITAWRTIGQLRTRRRFECISKHIDLSKPQTWARQIKHTFATGC